MDKTGTIGTVAIGIDITSLPALPAGYSVYNVMIDADGDFSSGAILYPLTLVSGNNYEAAGITPPDDYYIAIATVRPVIQFTSILSNVPEPNSPATIQLSMNYASSSNVTVDYTITGGTATNASDYVLANGTATITAGNTTTNIIITLINDVVVPKLSDHIGNFPCIIISPDDSQLILGSREERRKFLDGIIWKFNHENLERRITYKKVLAKRNTTINRFKEKKPLNYGEFKTPIEVVETLKKGTDITLVSYGSTLRLVQQAANELLEVGIDCEVIDLQSLLPFDINQDIVKSIAKTNRLLVIDEDVPGGASAYILQQIIEQQDAYNYLDSKPQTLTAKAHRPAYGTDGDYFSKPSAEDIFEKVYGMMNEVDPLKLPNLY